MLIIRRIYLLSITLLVVCLLVQPTVSDDVSDTLDGCEFVWPTGYGVHQTGQINATFDCYGRFDSDFHFYPYVDCWPNVNFETPPGSDLIYLWSGSLWIGGIVGDDTLVSTGIDGFSVPDFDGTELRPDGERPSVTRIDYPTDMSLRAEFSDTSSAVISRDPATFRRHTPLPIKVVHRSHTIHHAPFDKVILYDVVVTNVGDQTITGGCLGVFLDCDIMYDDYQNYWGAKDDLAGSLREHGLAYAIDNDGDPIDGRFVGTSPDRAIGLKFLKTSFVPRDTCFNWWQSSTVWLYDFGPRRGDTVFHEFSTTMLGTPYGDIDKYQVMSFPEWDYDQVFTAAIDSTDPIWLYPELSTHKALSAGGDTRFLFSVGPFDLEPDSSIRVLYCMLTGEFVHYYADNFRENLFYEIIPEWYLYNLNFSDILSAAYWAGVFADSMLHPAYAPTGLKTLYSSPDSTMIEWDPWVFDDVEGYDIYLGEVPADSLPYPGLAPPWPVDCPFEDPVSVGLTRQYALKDMDYDKVYQVGVANRMADGSGQICDPVKIIRRQHCPPPVVTSDIVFFDDTRPVRLMWCDSTHENVDHYNIYRFDDVGTALAAYHPFYDTRDLSDEMTPKDSFVVEGQTYYYYVMDVYARCDSGITTFDDLSCVEGMTYVISSVNKAGFESNLSTAIESFRIRPREKDILVMTNSDLPWANFVIFDTLKSFYDSVLCGLGASYDYDIYNYFDTVKVHGKNPIDWRQLLPYRVVIVDDGLAERILTDQYEDSAFGFTRYLNTGGRLVYFGGMNGLTGMTLSHDSAHIALDHWFLQRFFAADSEFYVSMAFFILNNLPLVDDMFAFTRAEAALEGFEDLDYDTSRYPFYMIATDYWPPETGPAVATFRLSADAELLYRFRSRNPTLSCLEGQPVGLRSHRDGAETYLFGFHLWYMNPAQARRLIDAIMVSSDCCLARGDFNHSGGNPPVDITDLTGYIIFLFGDGPPPHCPEEADINGDGLADIIDLTFLADFIFKGDISMPACP